MVNKLAPADMVKMEELLLSNVFTQEALINVLERKGMIQKSEIIEEIQHLRESIPVVSNSKPFLQKIISGGQTGADRAGIDEAIALGIPYGGVIPKGRRTEGGTLPASYDKMTESKSKDYAVRTKQNVMDSGATVIFTYDKIGRGSTLTMKIAAKHNKPHLHLNLSQADDNMAAKLLTQWLTTVKPKILNVAGSRESTSIGIYERVRNILHIVLAGS